MKKSGPHPTSFEKGPDRVGIRYRAHRAAAAKQESLLLPDHPTAPIERFATPEECFERFRKYAESDDPSVVLPCIRPTHRASYVGSLYCELLEKVESNERSNQAAKAVLDEYRVEGIRSLAEIKKTESVHESVTLMSEIGLKVPRAFEFLKAVAKVIQDSANAGHFSSEYELLREGRYALAYFKEDFAKSIALIEIDGAWYVYML